MLAVNWTISVLCPIHKIWTASTFAPSLKWWTCANKQKKKKKKRKPLPAYTVWTPWTKGMFLIVHSFTDKLFLRWLDVLPKTRWLFSVGFEPLYNPLTCSLSPTAELLLSCRSSQISRKPLSTGSSKLQKQDSSCGVAADRFKRFNITFQGHISAGTSWNPWRLPIQSPLIGSLLLFNERHQEQIQRKHLSVCLQKA